MFLPYGTTCYNDAPPWGTRLILLLNIAVFATVRFEVIDADAWIQYWQDPIHFSLIVSAFLHFEWVHLVTNLLYLWVLGRIVEGAIGTRPFLLLCSVIVLGANCLEAVVLYGREGGSYGASGLAFGLLAAAFLLAPRSKVHCFIMILYRPKLFKMSLGGFVALVIGLECLKLAMIQFPPSSALLHINGVVVGALVAYVCLKLGWLDAGGWDRLSLRERETPGPPHLTAQGSHGSHPTAKKCPSCGRPRSAKAPRCIYCGTE
jgi:membrane associated rhomboid family serine protease